MTQQPRLPALQVGLGTLFAVTAAVAMVFGVLRWMEVPPVSAVLVLAVLAVGAVAAVGLVVAIAATMDPDGAPDRQNPCDEEEKEGEKEVR